MAEPLREFIRLFDACRMAPSGRRAQFKPDDLGCQSASTGCQSLHPPSPYIIITQPENWYSLSVPRRVEGWVDLVGWLDAENGLLAHRRTPILVLTGSDVAQLRWSRPTRYHYAKPPNPFIPSINEMRFNLPETKNLNKNWRTTTAHPAQPSAPLTSGHRRT